MASGRTIAIIGLGNPGPEYRASRHNTGIMVVEALGRAEPLKPVDLPALPWRGAKNLSSEIATTRAHGVRLILAKPTAFMNLAGQAVTALKQAYRLGPENIWIIHDDLDLPLGKIQVRRGGGLAGHHGLESIARAVGTNQFVRFRVGIRGHALRAYHTAKGVDTNAFVMSPWTAREKRFLDRIISDLVVEITRMLTAPTLRPQTITVAGYETFKSPGE